MNQDQCFLLGKITKPFSFKGEVVLWMDVDDTTPYKNCEHLVDSTTGHPCPVCGGIAQAQQRPICGQTC